MMKNRTTEYRWLMMLSVANIKNKTINQEMIQELEKFAMKEQEVREALIEWEVLSSNKEIKALYEAKLKYYGMSYRGFKENRKEPEKRDLKRGEKKKLKSEKNEKLKK